MSIRIFISHSEADKALAKTLIELIRLALNVEPSGIRCTSVDGYKLPTGTKIPDQIKAEVFNCEVFVALLTPHSLRSTYVLFELGARWGHSESMFPLFAVGARPSDTNAWLSAFYGATAESEADVMQFVKDLGDKLVLIPAQTAVYYENLIEFVNQSKRLKNEYMEEHGAPDPQVQRTKEQEMQAEDERLFKSYRRIWNITNEYYVSKFRPSFGPDCPETLDGMLEAAKAPPGATAPDEDLITWPTRYAKRLSQDQRRVWQFVRAIYPAREPDMVGDVTVHSAIKPESEAESFHMTRRELAGFFQKWPAIVGRRFISTRFSSRLHYVLLLAWLELALVQWTQQRGRGKQDLFALAEYMVE